MPRHEFDLVSILSVARNRRGSGESTWPHERIELRLRATSRERSSDQQSIELEERRRRHEPALKTASVEQRVRREAPAR